MAVIRKHDRAYPRGWLSLFLRLGGWSALVFGAVLLVLTFISAVNLAIADRMDTEGRFASAGVVAKRITQSTDSDGDTTYSYYVTFRFKTPEGGHEVERNVGRAYYYDAEIGDERIIRYLQSEPDRIEHDIGAYRRGGVILRWVALFFGLAGLFMLWRYGSEANRAILARRDGEKRVAVITAIRNTNFKVNNRRQGRLEWREEDGRTGRSLMRNAEELHRLYDAGDKITVFRRGRHAVWEGDVGPPRREVEG